MQNAIVHQNIQDKNFLVVKIRNKTAPGQLKLCTALSHNDLE